MEAVRLGYPCMDALRAANANTAKRMSAENKVYIATVREKKAAHVVLLAEKNVEMQQEGSVVVDEVRLAEAALAAAKAEVIRIEAEIKLAKVNLGLATGSYERESCLRVLEDLEMRHQDAIMKQSNATADCHSFYKYLWNVSRNSLLQK
jgi:hypothetical protein